MVRASRSCAHLYGEKREGGREGGRERGRERGREGEKERKTKREMWRRGEVKEKN